METEVVSRSVSTNLDQAWSAAAGEGIHGTVTIVTVSVNHPNSLTVQSHAGVLFT